ncbi:MAG: zinc-finger domain-containing protein [Rhizobiaceae bacterium]
MVGHAVPYFQNDKGARAIETGAKEFMCCGASEPFDHPHVFLDMGDDTEIVCPYCSTLYRHSSDLSGSETRPAGCAWRPAA